MGEWLVVKWENGRMFICGSGKPRFHGFRIRLAKKVEAYSQSRTGTFRFYASQNGPMSLTMSV